MSPSADRLSGDIMGAWGRPPPFDTLGAESGAASGQRRCGPERERRQALRWARHHQAGDDFSGDA
ncbi:hypothetical protein [Streptomyces sp. DH7]|uniref:hypothetical protein n=1 Tax=Streptomyces sp. DH7 TaxID=2857006 RepID=UPI001E2D231A|nr:hypothetical protein [Streptomyces sp. DH7]